jgi:hypothetical protein
MNMKCKISLNKALFIINEWITEGDLIRNSFDAVSTNYKELEKRQEKRFIARFAPSSSFDLPEWSSDILSDFASKVLNWQLSIESKIPEIFEDKEPVIRFINDSSSIDRNISDFEYQERLVTKLKILAGMYRDIESRAWSPVEYIATMSIIRYFDSVCKLARGRNEDFLVNYMFKNHDFGEYASIEDIARSKTGLIGKDLDESHIDTIRNAVVELNKRTIKSFNFALLSTAKGEVALFKPHHETKE